MEKIEGNPVGQVVRLQTEGPEMTVGYMKGYSVICFWFNEAEPEEHEFQLTSLRPTKTERAKLSEIEAIQEGNKVKLKSGKVEMTVDKISTRTLNYGVQVETATCVWFENKRLITYDFPVSVLTAKKS